MDVLNNCVYMHVNKLNQQRYIGITCTKPEYRWNKGEGYYHNEHFYRAIQKYGWDEGFDHVIIESNLSREDACKLEKELILKYQTTDTEYGYNIGTGGEYGAEGSKRTAEQNERKSAQMKLVMNKKEIREKISAQRKGIKFSEEHRKSLSVSHMGKSPSNKGQHMSKEQKAVLKEKKRDKMIRVKCIENGKIYESIKEASLDLNLRSGNISQVCKGKRTQTGGFHFITM